MTRTIGQREVHPIGIGTWGMGGDRLPDGNLFADYRDDERHVRALRHALSRGQNHIDTAQIYGAGHTEEIVGAAIAGLDRSRLFIASKVWRSHSLRHAVPRAVETSLRKLGIDRLDLLYVHAPWDSIEMSEYIAGLNDAVDLGLTEAIGVSNFDTAQLARALSLSTHPIVANQIHFNLLERSHADADMRRLCAEHGVTIVAYRPLERRMLSDTAVSPVVVDVAREAGCTPAQVALAWLLAHDGVVAIPKASTPEHIDENVAATDVKLSNDLLARLDSVFMERGD